MSGLVRACSAFGAAIALYSGRAGLAAALLVGLGAILVTAHAWVRAGARDVIGCEKSGDFTELARFPAAR